MLDQSPEETAWPPDCVTVPRYANDARRLLALRRYVISSRQGRGRAVPLDSPVKGFQRAKIWCSALCFMNREEHQRTGSALIEISYISPLVTVINIIACLWLVGSYYEL